MQRRRAVPIAGWAVGWIYQHGESVLSVSGAVPLPHIAIVGAYAFGNTSWNGNLAPGATATFSLMGTAPGFPAPEPHRLLPALTGRP
ncbi:cellulose binding domain-containing protein [Streptosporangiaceae bacterium NEAU-GS5]|nr:cellulose binding domain-containing protein [Streptosporangiaceae bacterium NEAU-GS5]